MEPLTLALLALPGDPWDVFGPVLEHPETLLAGSRGGGGGRSVGGRAGARLFRAGEVLESGKLYRALKGRWFRCHHSRLECERLLVLYRRVRAYYTASFLCKAAPVTFLTFLGLADVLEREDAPTAYLYALISAIFLPQFGRPRCRRWRKPSRPFRTPCSPARVPKDCLRSFRGHGVHDVRLVLRVHSVLSALLVVVLTWTPLGRVKSRTLLLRR
ncbi:hypothetical protein [Methanopyrus sp.]